jgi:hypothetical protein
MLSSSKVPCLLFAVSTSFLLGNLALALEPTKHTINKESTTVESGDFGIYDPHTDRVAPTRSVKFKIGEHFGWRFKVKTSQPKVIWKEEFRLPVAPKTWGDLENGQTIGKDNKTCITERTESPKDGWIEHTWPELEGDPLGQYLMNVYVDGKLVRTFKFSVQ